MKKIYWLINLIILIACNRKANSIEDQVFPQIVPIIYDSISNQFDLPAGHEILVNPIDDHLDSMAVIMALKSIGNKDSKDYQMVDRLAKVLNDKIDFDFNSLSTSCRFTLISNAEEIKNYDFDKNEMIGSSTISPIILDQENEEALFYVDIQCGRSCGRGYFIFVVPDDNEWKISRMIPAWN